MKIVQEFFLSSARTNLKLQTVMRVNLRSVARIFLVVLGALTKSFVARAQEPQPAQSPPMNEVAAKMVDGIAHAKEKTVIVFDFSGPGNKQTALGQSLADEFAAARTKSSGK